MKDLLFRRGIIFSLLGHFALFGLFSFSFGPKILPVNYTKVYSWGQILKDYDFMRTQVLPKPKPRRAPDFNLAPEVKFKETPASKERGNDYYLKPKADFIDNSGKLVFQEKFPATLASAAKKEAVVFLHPGMPYHLGLYFKDRQNVHIELVFKVLSLRKASLVAVQRKISSGNLEVDLLSMRYLSHYLFMQQSRLNPDAWQSVKIDLSVK